MQLNNDRYNLLNLYWNLQNSLANAICPLGGMECSPFGTVFCVVNNYLAWKDETRLNSPTFG